MKDSKKRRKKMGNNLFIFLIILFINTGLGFFLAKRLTEKLNTDFSGEISDETLEESNMYYILNYIFDLSVIAIICSIGPIGTIILIYKIIKKKY